MHLILEILRYWGIYAWLVRWQHVKWDSLVTTYFEDKINLTQIKEIIVWSLSDLHQSNLDHFDGLVQDCSNSSALAMELLQSCAKPFISYLGMKSWDLHVCDRASTITHVDRVKKSNPWYNKIWLCLNVTIWSSQNCFSVIFIHFVMIQNIWEKKLHLLIIHTFFNHPSLLQLIFGRL